MKTAMSHKSCPSITKQNHRRPRLLRNTNKRVTQMQENHENVLHMRPKI